MASCTTYTCSSCDFTVDFWDDGNPYVQGPDGERHHFYHPGGEDELEQIVANILGHSPTAAEIDQVMKELAGRRCPSCKTGTFDQGALGAIS